MIKTPTIVMIKFKVAFNKCGIFGYSRMYEILLNESRTRVCNRYMEKLILPRNKNGLRDNTHWRGFWDNNITMNRKTAK